jgi:DNA-binding beta-propeller fold protein YncE
MSTLFEAEHTGGSMPAARRRGRHSAGSLVATVAASAILAATTGAAAGAHESTDRDGDRGGVVYAMTNDSGGNAIAVFLRDRRGRLHALPHAMVPTRGAGGSVTAAIDPLGSQGSLVYDDAHELLFAVNAGDNTVTAFEAVGYGAFLKRRSVVGSGGYIPVSVAVSEDLLYVLNAGGTGAVSTFAIGSHGELTWLDTLDLGLPATAMAPPFDQVNAPGQVGLDALARYLIITHAGGQEVLVAALDDQGLPGGPLVSTPSPGIVPFAFDVTPYGTTLVAEAASGSVSAYDPPLSGMPLTVTASAIATGQAATCWIVAHDAGFAYVSNTASNTLSLYEYTRTGSLVLVDDVAAMTGGAPTDLTLAAGGAFLYTLDAASGEISGFGVDPDSGALEPLGSTGGLPAAAGIQGIAARDF